MTAPEMQQGIGLNAAKNKRKSEVLAMRPPRRKPLILKGARQVGKTYILKEWGASAFPAVHYVNFETPQAASIFASDLDVRRIVRELGFWLNASIDISRDLLILDEIQTAPRALSALKYFCEDLPEFAVCAAGSLLGVILTDESFGGAETSHCRPETARLLKLPSISQLGVRCFDRHSAIEASLVNLTGSTQLPTMRRARHRRKGVNALMLIVRHPPGRIAERHYAYAVVLGEFLGLDYRLEEVEGSPDVILILSGDEGRELRVPDVFLAIPEAEWLTPAPALTELRKTRDTVRRFGGKMMLLWHNSSLQSHHDHSLYREALKILATVALVLVAWGASAPALAQSIIRVGDYDYVVIDAGSANGLKIGSRVCFHDDDDHEIACGTVRSIRARHAGIAIEPADKEKLAIGLTAHSAAMAPNTELRPRSPRALGLAYVAAPLLPFTYGIPAYSIDNEIAGTGALYEQDSKVTSSLLGIELSYRHPFTETLGLRLAMRYRTLPADELSVDYDRFDPTIFAKGETSASAFELESAASIVAPLDKAFAALGHGGLAVTRSVVTYDAKREGGGTSATIASYESTLLHVSLTLGGGLRWRPGPSTALDLTVEGLLPLADSASDDVEVTEKSGITSEAALRRDLREAVGHEPAAFGLLTALGLTLLL